MNYCIYKAQTLSSIPMELETIIGLEVHAQMNTKTKMFCGCDNDAWGKEPNTTVCPICMGHPGTLPVPNKSAVEKAIRASKALQCTVNARSHFDRKNYFYPDLPAGYQISQYSDPLASKGEVKYEGGMRCGIHRLHLENDAGKLTHRSNGSLCDYNRAGTPLMEIVTEPDLRSADEAVAFAQELRRILIAADASEADMYKGMMRFDASISLRPKGEKKLYPRIEIKNLNSFKSLERALNYQKKQLEKLWAEGKAPTGEVTVGWMDDEEKTVVLRDKESAADYRYFPEPDIPPLELSEAYIASIAAAMTKLPSQRKEEYVNMGLTDAEALLLIEQPQLQNMFNAIYDKTKDAKRASSLVLTQLIGFLKQQNKSIEQAPGKDDMLALATAIASGEISTNAGKEVLEEMIGSGKSPAAIIEEKGLKQVSDTGAILEIVKKAIAANPQSIEAYKGGKASALGPIVGWVMKESKGKANPKMVNDLLQQEINK